MQAADGQTFSEKEESLIMPDLPQQAIMRAKQSIGVTENPSNWGRWVRQYLESVGILTPAPWCAAFLNFKIKQAANDLGIKSRWPKTGYVQSIVNWAKKQPVGSITYRPVTNSVFVVYHPELKRYAHTGFISEVRSLGKSGYRILTVEGNSNTTGSREGTKVVSTWRRWTDNHRCIRIV